MTEDEAAVYLAIAVGKTHVIGKINFQSGDICNGFKGKIKQCCKPTQTLWSLNRFKEIVQRRKQDEQLTSTRRNSWGS